MRFVWETVPDEQTSCARSSMDAPLIGVGFLGVIRISTSRVSPGTPTWELRWALTDPSLSSASLRLRKGERIDLLIWERLGGPFPWTSVSPNER